VTLPFYFLLRILLVHRGSPLRSTERNPFRQKELRRDLDHNQIRATEFIPEKPEIRSSEAGERADEVDSRH
jgi:hypothetical protein